MRASLSHTQRGTVVLVALCFVAVLGITLTTYMVVCTRAMTLSGRSGLKSVSEQLAENGLEEAMRALNNSDFNSWTYGSSPNQTICTWSVSGTTATGTLTLPSTQYGSQGISGTAYIKVFNYNNPSTIAPWDAYTNYSVGDIVNYAATNPQGVKVVNTYQCTAANSNTLPTNISNWSPITPYAYSEGVATFPDSANTSIVTLLRADLSIAPMFPHALAGNSGSNPSVAIRQGGTINSYDSSLGTYASQTPTYQASVVGPYVTLLGSTTIKGFVGTSSGTYSTSAIVRSAITNIAVSKIDPLRVSTIYNIPSNAIILPSYSPSNLPPGAGSNTTLKAGGATLGIANTTTYYRITDTNNGNTGIWLNNTSDTLTINGNVIIDVDVSSSNWGLVTINGTIIINIGSSLVVRSKGPIYIGAYSGWGYSGGVRNLNLDPSKCLLISTSTSSCYLCDDTYPFYGVLYTPSATLYIDSAMYLYGAASARSISSDQVYSSGTSAIIRYDTALRTASFSVFRVSYIISNWHEITDPGDAQRITLP
jgi:hypothetical protein